MSQPPPPPRVPVVEKSNELNGNGKILSAHVEEVAEWKSASKVNNGSTSEAPRPFRFRIQATVNSSKNPPTISDTTFVIVNPSSSFCNLSNETLRVVIPRSTITNPDCTINLSAIEEETGDIFMSINLNVGGGNLTKLKLHHKHVHITLENKAKKTKNVNIKGHLHFGDDEGTKQMKTMEQRASSLSAVPPRWRTGYISVKCKGENLPLNQKSTNTKNMKTAAVSPDTENSIFLFSCKHLIRTQHHATSSRDSGAIQLKLAKTREAKDRKNLYMVLFICFLFLLVGIIFFPLMEGWTVLDALYFGVVTLTTVGYGDLLPTSDGSKVFTTLFVFFGVSIVATTIGLLQTYLIEAAALRADLKKRQQRKQMLDNESDSDSDEEKEEEDQKDENSTEEQNVEEKHIEKKSARHHLARHSSLSPLAIQSQSTRSKSSGSNKCCDTIKFFALQFLPPVLIGILGILVMMYGQNERFVDALYWSVVTGTTVGYGDISPKLPGTRLFALFYLFVTIVTTGKALGAFGTLFETDDDTNQKLLNKQLDENFLAGLDQDGGGEVSEFEYLSAMLVLLEYVEQDDIDRVMKAFRKLDKDGSCTLSVSDLKHNLKRNRVKKKGLVKANEAV